MQVKINKYSDTLKGVTTLNNKEIEIPYAIKDEIVEISNNKITKIINKSKYRVEPLCKLFDKCGGCSIQHINYLHQLEIKKDIVKDLFNNTFKKDYYVSDTIGMDNPFNYRTKNQFVYKYSYVDKKIICGFYEEGTHNVIDNTSCIISNTIACNIAEYVKHIMFKLHYNAYDEDKHTGLIRHILVKNSTYNNEIMVVIVTSQSNFPGSNNFVKELINKFPNISTVIQNINGTSSSAVLGKIEKVLYGKGYIIDKLLGCTFKVHSRSFYQVNHIQCEKLYSKAIEFAHLNKNEVILDTYCGVGTIGILASKYVKKVLSCEIVKSAIDAAIDNAKHNNIKNIEFYLDDASKFMKSLANKHFKVDCVIMDPPRNGSDKVFLNSLLELKPLKVIYISCNPYTLVNDLKVLLKEYKITHIQPVDMFCHTSHIETIVSLDIKK